MTADEALTIHQQVQVLLCQQHDLLTGEEVDFDAAEQLGAEVSALLASVPNAEHLSGLDATLRARLLDQATQNSAGLARCRAALELQRQRHRAEHLRSERDGAALKGYQAANGNEPPRYLDERR